MIKASKEKHVRANDRERMPRSSIWNVPEHSGCDQLKFPASCMISFAEGSSSLEDLESTLTEEDMEGARVKSRSTVVYLTRELCCLAFFFFFFFFFFFSLFSSLYAYFLIFFSLFSLLVFYNFLRFRCRFPFRCSQLRATRVGAHRTAHDVSASHAGPSNVPGRRPGEGEGEGF